MAVRWAFGAELQTTGEWAVNTGTVALESTIVRNGTRSVKALGTNNSFADFFTLPLVDEATVACYFYTTGNPASRNPIIQSNDATGVTFPYTVAMQSNGTIGIKLGSSAATPVEVNSAGTVPLNQWVRLEIRYSKTQTKSGASGAGRAILSMDGTDVAEAGGISGYTPVGFSGVAFGPRAVAQTTYWDDCIHTDAYETIGAFEVILRTPKTGTPTYNTWTGTGADPYWANIPTDTAVYMTASASNQKQTKLINPFSAGSQLVNSYDNILALYPIQWARKASTNTTNTYASLFRHNGADQTTSITLTTTAVQVAMPLVTSGITLATADACEPGGSQITGTGTSHYRITDAYVYAVVTRGTPPPTYKPNHFLLFE